MTPPPPPCSGPPLLSPGLPRLVRSSAEASPRGGVDRPKGVTVTRAGAFTINVAAVLYLLLAKHLFGLRGGRQAYDSERRGEQLLEVERSALGSDPRHPGGGRAPAGSTADRAPATTATSPTPTSTT